MPVGSKSPLLPTAFSIFVHIASLHIGAPSSGMVSGMQIQPLVPSARIVPSPSITVAFALIEAGAADRAWAFLSLVASPALAVSAANAVTKRTATREMNIR